MVETGHTLLEYFYRRDFLCENPHVRMPLFGWDPSSLAELYWAGFITYPHAIHILEPFEPFELTHFRLSYKGLWKRWLLFKAGTFDELDKQFGETPL